MPMPLEYSNASQDFEAFLADAMEELDLATRNMTYTTVQAVLVVFRRRLTLDEAIAFAAVLPAVLRAIFVADWDLKAERLEFGTVAAMNDEVKLLRRNHNFSPDDAIQRVAKVLQRHVDKDQLRRVLAEISPEAEGYWRTS
ncbi:MAG: DUF2267 domain-containing protein [Pseudomonadota bacterium]